MPLYDYAESRIYYVETRLQNSTITKHVLDSPQPCMVMNNHETPGSKHRKHLAQLDV